MFSLPIFIHRRAWLLFFFLSFFTGYEAHIVTGTAAGISCSIAACLTGENQHLISLLPNTSAIARNVIVDGGSDTRWNNAAALTGANLVTLGSEQSPMTESQLNAELSKQGREKPVAVLVYAGAYEGGLGMGVERIVRLGNERGVPVIVDAAAQLPPKVSANLYC